MWRAGGENELRNRSVPAGKEVVTRRVVLDQLAELGLRNELDEQELDLHLLPDGAWSVDQISSVIMRCAELQALKYCVGIDRHLGPLEDLQALPTSDVAWLGKLQSASSSLAPVTYDIRKERDEAAAYFLRCLAEKRRRGLYQVDLDEELIELLDSASVHAADESHDLLLGTQTVANASQRSLAMATEQSHFRFETLSNVLTELEAPAKTPESQLGRL